ncbi:SCO family protein [Wenzhouxiangella sp. XN201]|uniref:SCO family protein n=1 Tax=Wenzhouxiangella sp. XN201 TaxID=2710755 RepID=UPI0013C6F611|nr:SCO family protein [Wenzhouxiangella sp. XN201]NEZ05043.1 SCO family protein [Wenzhouxiangella sp. XN201]
MNTQIALFLAATLMATAATAKEPQAGEHEGHDAHAHHTPMHAEAVTHDHSLFHLDAEWRTQQGEPFRLEQLAGRPTVITMIYGSCTTACPVLVNDARRIDRAAPVSIQDDLQVVIVSFDPARDTPERMADYADSYEVDAERWHFLHGDPADIRTLAAVLGVRYRDNGDGTFDHSNLISLLDTTGRVVHRSEGLARPVEPVVAALEQLPES